MIANIHPPTPTPDLSALLNLPQFQGLVNLAQTNPALFNQLTNSSYFDVPTSESYIKNDSSTSTPISGILTPNSTPVVGTPIPPATAEDLEASLKSLATELGFESDNNGLDYVNMDDFLSTYSKL